MNEGGCNMSNIHEISDRNHPLANFEWEKDKAAVEDDASYDYEYDYEYEYDDDDACDSGDGDVLPTDIESTKRALRRLSIQMHAAIDGSLLVNSEANRRNTWTNKDDVPSKESDPWTTSKRASTPDTLREVAEVAKAVSLSCDTILDGSGYIEEVIDDDEYEEEVIEEEILTDDEDFFDMVVDTKQLTENAVVGEFNGTIIYSEVTQPSFTARRQARVAEMETLDERSVETDVDLRYQLDQWRDLSYRSVATTGNEERIQNNNGMRSDGAAEVAKEHEDSQDGDHPASDDDKENGDEDDDDDVTPEDVKEAIVYILKQEKPIDKGHLTSEQATRMMALPFADQKEILKHFELCDNAGDPICWDLLVAMSNPEDGRHEDESIGGASEVSCSCGRDSGSACPPVCPENGDDPVLNSVSAKKSTFGGADSGYDEEIEEEITLEEGEELDPDDGHVDEETIDEEVVEETEHEEEVEEIVEEVEPDLDPGSSSVHTDDDDDDDLSESGSGSYLSSDDEHEAPEVESLGSGEYSLQADSTHCASSVTYNDDTEAGSDEEDDAAEEAQNLHLQAMRRDRKLRQQAKSF